MKKFMFPLIALLFFYMAGSAQAEQKQVYNTTVPAGSKKQLSNSNSVITPLKTTHAIIATKRASLILRRHRYHGHRAGRF